MNTNPPHGPTDVPRYFFHLHDHGVDIDDEAGASLASDGEARCEAMRRAEVLIAARDAEAWHRHDWRLTVLDQEGQEVVRLSIDRHRPNP